MRGEEGGGSERFRRLPESVQRLADVGSSEADSDDVRLRKRVLNLAAALMATLSPIWVTTYLALGGGRIAQTWARAGLVAITFSEGGALVGMLERNGTLGVWEFELTAL